MRKYITCIASCYNIPLMETILKIMSMKVEILLLLLRVEMKKYTMLYVPCEDCWV